VEPGYEARSGDEFDATTRWRHVCARMQRPRVRARIKRQMRRRGRRWWKRGRALDEQRTTLDLLIEDLGY